MVGLSRIGFKFRASALVATAGMAIIAGGAPASAATEVVVVSGTAHLPQFPCRSNPCSGGTFTGNVPAANGPYKLKKGIMTANYSYTEQCSGAGVPLSGTANGTFTIQGKPDVASGSFSWVRTGLTANIQLSGISVNGSGSHSGTAVALFEPVGNGLCPPGTSNVTNAQVQIVATIN